MSYLVFNFSFMYLMEYHDGAMFVVVEILSTFLFVLSGSLVFSVLISSRLSIVAT